MSRRSSDHSWYEGAACNGADIALFYPKKAGEKGMSIAEYRAGMEYCHKCPVRIECLSYAIENNEQHGLWGGTTPVQRRAMRRLGKAVSA